MQRSFVRKKGFDGSAISSASTGLLHRLKAVKLRKPLVSPSETLSLAF